MIAHNETKQSSTLTRYPIRKRTPTANVLAKTPFERERQRLGILGNGVCKLAENYFHHIT